jgi:hypothetical protein
MRDLSKQFSDKMLRSVLKQLEDSFHYEYNGYSVGQRYEEGYCEIVDDVVKYYGLHDLEWEEYGFFFQLMELNPDYRDENKQIKVPKLGMYDVYYESEERQWITYIYQNRVYGYGKDMIKDQCNNDANFEYYAGKIVREDINDSEVTSGGIVDVEEVKKR